MAWVTLSVGSNTRPCENFCSCLDMLLLQFRDLALSSVYESRGDHHQSIYYLNMAVGFETGLPLADLALLLKKIEDKHHRARTPEPGAEVTIDLDLLTYDDKAGTFNGVVLPHPDIITKAYVLKPLLQIAGKRQHPVLKKTYSELGKDLLARFEQAGQQLRPVAFEWHGRVLSKPE